MNFPPSLLIPDFIIREKTVAVALAPAQLLLAADPNRITLMIQATVSTPNAFISTLSGVTTTKGFFVPNAVPMILWHFQHGSLVGKEWWVVGSGALNVQVIEVVYQPRR